MTYLLCRFPFRPISSRVRKTNQRSRDVIVLLTFISDCSRFDRILTYFIFWPSGNVTNPDGSRRPRPAHRRRRTYRHFGRSYFIFLERCKISILWFFPPLYRRHNQPRCAVSAVANHRNHSRNFIWINAKTNRPR